MILDIDPKVDYAFKHVFGREATKSILIDLLNQVLDLASGHRIVDIELLNPFNPKESFNDKESFLDIKAREESGRQFNVEMQMLFAKHYPKRIVYYGSKLYSQQLLQGEDYALLQPMISISFLNHQMFPQSFDYHLRFRLLEDRHHFPLMDDIEYHFFELPKFRKTAEELTTGLDIWLYFLRHAAKIDLEAVPTTMQSPPVLRALEELKMLTQSDIERERYESRRKFQMDYTSDMNEQRREGRQEGRQEGLFEARIKNVHFCEQFLGRAITPSDQLDRMSFDELSKLADRLMEEVLQRK